ncbi:hypothetical protein N7526_008562 [Penicillium atrosanguineum]|nr:hypothetical protein N7526_008562 [Penicillium atrosanguineum]
MQNKASDMDVPGSLAFGHTHVQGNPASRLTSRNALQAAKNRPSVEHHASQEARPKTKITFPPHDAPVEVLVTGRTALELLCFLLYHVSIEEGNPVGHLELRPVDQYRVQSRIFAPAKEGGQVTNAIKWLLAYNCDKSSDRIRGEKHIDRHVELRDVELQDVKHNQITDRRHLQMKQSDNAHIYNHYFEDRVHPAKS